MKYHRFKFQSVVVFLILTVSSWAVAKDELASKRLTTEQILNHLRSIKNPSLLPAVSNESFRDVKCGFGIQAQVINRWKEFSDVQRAELSLLIKANVMQSDTIAGHFHIFYDTTGNNEPALLDNNNQRIPGTAKAYIDSVARIFNHVWDVEVDQMGYSAPPFESGQSYYNIYIQDISEYGDTWTVEPPINGTEVPPRYTSYITIDNDYKEYSSHGINGLKVTAAHEFHHAIQIGSYGLFDVNYYRYVHELTSTWMEDVVYTDVNDYYNYLPDYFRQFSDGRSFNFNPGVGGYERCVWAHYMAKQFGSSVIRKVWEAMRDRAYTDSTDVFIESNAAVLASTGTTLQAAFSEFTKWNYFTADRADTINYYPEGNNYPRFKPLQKTDFYYTTSIVSGDVQPLSSSMYEFDTQQDTITAIIANVDIGSAIIRNTTLQKIDVTLSSQSLSPPYQEFTNGLKAKISVDNLSLWPSFFMQSSTHTIVNRLQLNASPNPFRLAGISNLFLPINEDKASWANVYIYNSAFNLSYSAQLHTSYYENGGTRVIEVPASEVKSKLSSGVYFILAKTVNGEYKWKVAVIR